MKFLLCAANRVPVRMGKVEGGQDRLGGEGRNKGGEGTSYSISEAEFSEYSGFAVFVLPPSPQYKAMVCTLSVFHCHFQAEIRSQGTGPVTQIVVSIPRERKQHQHERQLMGSL